MGGGDEPVHVSKVQIVPLFQGAVRPALHDRDGRAVGQLGNRTESRSMKMPHSFLPPGVSQSDLDGPKSVCACGEELTGFFDECDECRENKQPKERNERRN